MPNPPLVDVLIPVYNGEAFIRSSLASIQQQSLADIRIHVVDDGSTDRTPAILAEIAAADDRVRIHTKPNGGIVDALNFGLPFCTAPFIARHDADDLAQPTRFAQQVQLLRDRPEVVATGSAARHVDTQGASIGTTTTLPPTDRADPAFFPAREPYLLHPFLMIRREAMADVAGYRHVVHAEDADLYWRLQERGILFNDDRVLGDYRIHADSISSQSVRNGRIMAVSSQLCALSARRRRAGRPDLTFSPAAAARLKQAAGSLAEACAAGETLLDAAEFDHFRLAVGAKLLELADYRPYEPDRSDCLFVRDSLDRGEALLTAANRQAMRDALSGTAARLAALGRWRDARVLLRPGMARPFWSRYLLRKMLPVSAHRRIRHLVRPILSLVR